MAKKSKQESLREQECERRSAEQMWEVLGWPGVPVGTGAVERVDRPSLLREALALQPRGADLLRYGALVRTLAHAGVHVFPADPRPRAAFQKAGAWRLAVKQGNTWVDIGRLPGFRP